VTAPLQRLAEVLRTELRKTGANQDQWLQSCEHGANRALKMCVDMKRMTIKRMASS